jgi:hypothetical protein
VLCVCHTWPHLSWAHNLSWVSVMLLTVCHLPGLYYWHVDRPLPPSQLLYRVWVIMRITLNPQSLRIYTNLYHWKGWLLIEDEMITSSEMRDTSYITVLWDCFRDKNDNWDVIKFGAIYYWMETIISSIWVCFAPQ